MVEAKQVFDTINIPKDQAANANNVRLHVEPARFNPIF